MKNRFLFTRIFIGSAPKEGNEIERLKNLGLKVEDEKEETAALVLDIEKVIGVFESIDNKTGKNRPDQCAIERSGRRTVWIATPYYEMIKLWTEYNSDDIDEVRPPDVGQAVATLSKALGEDRKEGSLYYGYQSNIAMSFVDVWENYIAGKGPLGSSVLLPKPELVADLSNQAAKNFLDMLINSTK